MHQIGIKPNNKSCEFCILGKQTRTPFPKIQPSDKTTVPLFRVFSDICGPINPISFGNAKYVLTFNDQATGYSWIYFIPNKASNTVLALFKRWLAMVERQSGKKLKFFFTDGGKEYTGETVKNTFTTFLKDSGIEHDTTTAYSSPSNGTAERLNRTLFDMARPALIKSKIPTPFWAEALDSANKVRNRLPTKSLANNKSPHEAWFGKKPSLKHLRQFGCVAFHRVPDEIITKGAKLDPRSIKCCLLGYIGNRLYRLWNPEQQKLIISRDAKFHEDEFLPLTAFGNIPSTTLPLQTPFDHILDDEDPDINEFSISAPTPTSTSTSAPTSQPFITPKHPVPPQYLPTTSPTAPIVTPNPYALLAPIPPVPIHQDDDSDDDDDSPIISNPSPNSLDTPNLSLDISNPSLDASTTNPPCLPQEQQNPPPQPSRQSTRIRQATQRKQESDAGAKMTYIPTIHTINSLSRIDTPPANYTPTYSPIEPHTLEEALSGPDAHLWQAANDKEMQSLFKNNTFTIVPRPPDQNIVSTKFVWKIKSPETNNPIYKSRFVARGFSQIPGQDFTETFAPVPRTTSIRLLFSYAAANQLYINHFDIETAFLTAELDKIIFAEQPKGYHDAQYPHEDYVLRLNKGLYGLKQSGYLWFNHMKTSLTSLGFKQSDADQSVFIRQTHDNTTTILGVYVDDFLVISNSIQQIDHLETELSQFYTVRNLGPVKRFLGMDIHRPTPTGPIYLSQSTYARKILHRFGMQNCNPAKTPFADTTQLHKRLDDEEPADETLYREMIGSIGYLPTYTRPDLAFTVSKLSQYLSNPSVLHMQAAKHVLRYIKGTLDYGIYYAPSSEPHPFGFCDSSHAADPDDRKSHAGLIFFFNLGGIIWESGKESVVAISSMESEYMELSEAAKEAIFLRKLSASINIPINKPTMILTDSQSALNHVKNNVKHARTKHIDTRFHYIREVYTANQVDLQHVPAVDQAADILTKPLGLNKHIEAVKLLKLVQFPYEQSSRL